ncbi:MAG: DUF615 domain-containing protein [Gammaproteobacteria bacterium]|nr:DUF615 domain-containing protein [Gammaproteobacteria bacterium]
MNNLIDREESDNLDEKSKTQIKTELAEITDFGAHLAKLGSGIIKKLPLSEEIFEAYNELNRIKGHEARKRHFKRIGKLLRSTDNLDEIKLSLEQIQQGLVPSKQGEESPSLTWFQKLIEEQVDAEAFIQEYPNCDRQQLRQLIRNTIKQPSKHKQKFIQFINQYIQQ